MRKIIMRNEKMNFNTAKLMAKKIVSKMTIEEKASQLLYNSPAIERLGIHEYNWWNESSHGVARAGTATVFPHSIGLAATFDPERIFEVADVISTEAKYSLQGTTQGRYLTGGVPPVRFSM